MQKTLLFYFYLFTLIGCATTELSSISQPEYGIPGSYHRIAMGETLWRISKIYNVDLEEIAKLNNINDAASIEVGRTIFIPQRQKEIVMVSGAIEDFIWPIKGKVIAYFGDLTHQVKNKGIDIQPYDNLEVVASRSGKAVFCADNFKSFGKTIIIDHRDGFLTVYARNAQVFIKPGDNIQKGAVIARSGYAGRDKNVYLHFEIRKNNTAQNPYFYLAQ